MHWVSGWDGMFPRRQDFGHCLLTETYQPSSTLQVSSKIPQVLVNPTTLTYSHPCPLGTRSGSSILRFSDAMKFGLEGQSCKRQGAGWEWRLLGRPKGTFYLSSTFCLALVSVSPHRSLAEHRRWHRWDLPERRTDESKAWRFQSHSPTTLTFTSKLEIKSKGEDWWCHIWHNSAES